jgi:hypothetical protein
MSANTGVKKIAVETPGGKISQNVPHKFDLLETKPLFTERG